MLRSGFARPDTGYRGGVKVRREASEVEFNGSAGFSDAAFVVGGYEDVGSGDQCDVGR